MTTTEIIQACLAQNNAWGGFHQAMIAARHAGLKAIHGSPSKVATCPRLVFLRISIRIIHAEGTPHAIGQCVRAVHQRSCLFCASWPAAVLQRILDPHHIDHLFTQTAQRQYTNELLFSSLVDLMTRVVIGQEPSVHAAYRKLEDQLPGQRSIRLQQTPASSRTGRLPLRWSVIPPDASHPSSCRPAGLVAPALARLPRQVSRRQPSRGYGTSAWRNYASTWAAPLPGSSPWRSSTKNT